MMSADAASRHSGSKNLDHSPSPTPEDTGVGRTAGTREPKPSFTNSSHTRRAAPTKEARKNRNVFVVHGRDEEIRERLFELLRAVDLRPLEWEAIVATTRHTAPSLLAVVQSALANAQAVVVLLTPDDVVNLHPSLHQSNEPSIEVEATMQPRPNVMIELGMALGRCPERTIIVEVGDLRPVADLNGLNVIKFDGSEVTIGKLVQRLKMAGCKVDDSGADWRNSKRFRGLSAYSRRANGRSS